MQSEYHNMVPTSPTPYTMTQGRIHDFFSGGPDNDTELIHARNTNHKYYMIDTRYAQIHITRK